MQKLPFITRISPLFFLMAFMAACRGQADPKAPESDKAPLALPGEQISEYVVSARTDSKGNLWFGTMSDGVARYDGQSLTYFSTKEGLCDDTVASITEDPDGNLWFGTHNGASRYDGKTFHNFGQYEGLQGSGCKILIDRKGQVWAGTNKGVFRFNGISFTPFPLPNPVVEKPSYKVAAGKVWDILEDKNGNIWFARDGFGVCRYDGTAFTHFTQKDGLCSNIVSHIVEDKQGNLWFGCLSSDFPKNVAEGGVNRFDGKTFTRFSDIEGLHNRDVYTIYEDRSGKIWIGATGLGAYRYDGKTFTLFKETDRMDLTANFGLQAMTEDKNGTLWFGFSGGLFRFNGDLFTNVMKGGTWK